jgi:hypothetical protein
MDLCASKKKRQSVPQLIKSLHFNGSWNFFRKYKNDSYNGPIKDNILVISIFNRTKKLVLKGTDFINIQKTLGHG